MPIIEITTGNVCTRRRSAKTILFHCPTAREGGREVALFAAARNAGAIQKVSGFSNTIASLREQDGRMVPPAIGGQMISNRFNVPSGTILKFFYQRSESWQHTIGRTHAAVGPAHSTSHTGMQFYRVREGAAVVSIRYTMVEHACVVEGARFSTLLGPLEAITPAEAEAETGNAVPPQFRKLFQPEALNLYRHNTVISAQTIERRVLSPLPVAEAAAANPFEGYARLNRRLEEAAATVAALGVTRDLRQTVQEEQTRQAEPSATPAPAPVIVYAPVNRRRIRTT